MITASPALPQATSATSFFDGGMAFNAWDFALAILGLVLTVLGFVIAYLQLQKTLTAAQAAKTAAGAARTQVAMLGTYVTMSHLCGMLGEVAHAVRNGEAKVAIIRLDDVRRGVVQLRSASETRGYGDGAPVVSQQEWQSVLHGIASVTDLLHRPKRKSTTVEWEEVRLAVTETENELHGLAARFSAKLEVQGAIE